MVDNRNDKKAPTSESEESSTSAPSIPGNTIGEKIVRLALEAARLKRGLPKGAALFPEHLAREARQRLTNKMH